MERDYYRQLVERSLSKEHLPLKQCEDILASPDIELLPLLDAAFQIRKKHFGKEVTVHILNNVQNGRCPEDCKYCAQSKDSRAEIVSYPLKSDEQVLKEAKIAYESGAHRYCMVFSGHGPSEKRIEHLVAIIKSIKREYPIEVCVSPGVVDEKGIKKLKEAGLDRLNHNLNTSANHYKQICTTHTYKERLATLATAQKCGLNVCSGIIIGMGEKHKDIIEVSLSLRKYGARSIPVNFLIPIEGIPLTQKSNLTPQYCLRILCLFRFLNPDAEIRMAAGRELHLRDMESLALYPANSLFLDGYLNVKGSTRVKTLRMIKDAGFTIKSSFSIDDLLKKEEMRPLQKEIEGDVMMKTLDDLYPQSHSS